MRCPIWALSGQLPLAAWCCSHRRRARTFLDRQMASRDVVEPLALRHEMLRGTVKLLASASAGIS